MATEKKTQSKASTAKYKIKVTKNGPYIVSGGVPLAEQKICTDSDGNYRGWLEGKKFPAQESYALCRCGHSKNPPFCDGTHTAINFDGTETASNKSYLDQARTITGKGLDLTDYQELCAGAGFCDRAGGIWKLMAKSGNPETCQTIIEEAGDCPSGRLVVWDKEGKALEPKFKPSIGLIYEPQKSLMGPLWIRGGIQVESAEGTKYEIRNRMTLCRCGKSLNKPFCDGMHLKEERGLENPSQSRLVQTY
jgi:CDGSH-type Zn-finger protein